MNTRVALGIEVIPVIDVMGGKVVHAVRGHRDAYRALESQLTPGHDAIAIARALVAHCASRVLYLADLDALLGRARQYRLLAAVAAALPGRELWIDAAWHDADDLSALAEALGPAAAAVTPVIGTESLGSRAEAERLLASRADVVLSLDRRGGAPLDPGGCWEAPELWPGRVIVMTLDRVGADTGPDLDTFASVRDRAPDHVRVIGAGGICGVDDLRAARAVGAGAWLVASALHRRRIPPLAAVGP